MKPHTKKYFKELGGLLGLDLLFFGTTNATKVPSLLLMIGLLVLAATIYQLIYGALGAARLYGIKIKRRRHTALMMTCMVGALIAWQSIGELSGRDFVVLLPLVTIAYLYSTYNVRNRKLL